eukprot:354277-Chlamydomonas_euryale.AAC.4
MNPSESANRLCSKVGDDADACMPDIDSPTPPAWGDDARLEPSSEASCPGRSICRECFIRWFELVAEVSAKVSASGGRAWFWQVCARQGARINPQHVTAHNFPDPPVAHC